MGKQTLFFTAMFALVVSKESWAVSIIPTLPDAIPLPAFTYNMTNNMGIVSSYSQSETTIHGLPTLIDELSYNCLSNNYELALIIPSTFIYAATYRLEATVGNGWVYDVYRNIVGSMHFLPADVVTVRGQVSAVNESIELSKAYFTWGNTATNVTVTTGFFNDIPLEELTEDKLKEVESRVHSIVHETSWSYAQTIIVNYLHQNILNSISMEALIELVAGSCSGKIEGNPGSRGALFPEPLIEIRQEPVTYHVNVSIRHADVTYERVFSGLSDLQDELSYNCLTGNVEFSIHAKSLAVGGPFNLTGVIEYSTPMELAVEGHVEETCPMFAVQPDESCLLIFTGVIQDHGSHVSMEKFLGDYWLDIEYFVDAGMVGGEEVTEENARYVYPILKSEISPHLRGSFWDAMEQQVNELLKNVSMSELIELTGGSSNCASR